MMLSMLKSKNHRATVTEADLNYTGSLTIDRDLMDRRGHARAREGAGGEQQQRRPV